MRLAVLADDHSYEELLKRGVSPGLEIIRIDQPAVVEEAELYMDLSFDNSRERLKAWEAVSPSVLFIGAVEFELDQTGFPIVVFNGWPGFLEREVLEAGGDETHKEIAGILAAALNRKLEWLQPVPGLVSARVISMIINEAYLSLEEGVSDEASIDTAMKLGTNYPYGPFEWAEKIGIKRVFHLLNGLSKIEKRYLPAASLAKKAAEK